MSQDPRRLRDYQARINRAIDFIEARLAEDLNLAEVARVAAFSPYHFHRIFAAALGETLHSFVKRLRLERAATRLVLRPDEAVTDIALDCGFSGSATFARAFKSWFGVSATEWRERGGDRKISKPQSNSGQPFRKAGEDLRLIPPYLDGDTQTWRIAMKSSASGDVQVTVKTFADQPVAYVRHIGPYAGDGKLFEELFTRLGRWAGPRGLMARPDAVMMSVYHDNPEITDEEKLRVTVCVTVPPETEVSGEVGKMTIPGGDYAVGRFELSSEEFAQAWNVIFGVWLPQSGYEPDDRPAFEMYHNDPRQHPEGKSIVDICVPVKPTSS